MIEYIKYIPLSLFALSVVRPLILGPSWESVSYCFVLGIIALAFEFATSQRQLNSISQQLQELSDKTKEKDRIVDDLRSSVATLKIFKTTGK